MRSGPVIFLAAALLLSACAEKQGAMQSEAQREWTKVNNKDAIVSLMSESTLYGRSGNWKYAIYYRDDGTSRAKSWFSTRVDYTPGEWRVSDDGEFCSRYREWDQGVEHCWILYRSDDKLRWERLGGQETQITDLPVDGNPEGL